MADLDAVLEQLKKERERAVGELKQLEKVIADLSRVTTKGHGSSSRLGKRKHQLSAAARERIAAAQRARWAKVRAQSKKVL